MGKRFNDILDEIKQFINGKTLDALVPPLVYLVANNFFDLKVTVILALGTAIFFAIKRLINKESLLYALGGILGVLLASGLALFSDNASNYFLPGFIGSGIMFLISLISVLVGKPLAALVSHLSRSWEFAWFMRKDIKPAYREVTLAWSLLFLVRMILQGLLLSRGNLTEITWVNLALGFPATFIVLILTLIYGLWRLQNLKGPGIDEFRDKKSPPWRGQTKGF